MRPYPNVTQVSLLIPETTVCCYVLFSSETWKGIAFLLEKPGRTGLQSNTKLWAHTNCLVVVLRFCIYSQPNYRHGTQPQTWLVHLCFGCTNTYKWNKKPRKGFLILTAAEPLPSCTTSGFPSYNYGRTRSLVLSHIWTFSSAEGKKVVLMRSQTIQMIRPEEGIVIICSSLLHNTRQKAFLNYLIFEV